MLPETITKAQSCLPATREELEERLGLQTGSGQRIVRYLLKHGYATQWGDKLNAKGVLVRIIHTTEKKP